MPPMDTDTRLLLTEVKTPYDEFGDLPLGERAYRQISYEVMTCALPPGEILSANEFAGRLGISRTPVSSALARLCDEGLVESMPRLGYRVSDVTAIDLREIFECRLSIEPAAVSAAIERASDEELGALADEAEHPSHDPADPADISGRIKSREYFHYELAALSGNSRLERTIGKLIQESHRAFVVFSSRRLQEGIAPPPKIHHSDIAKAMVARDRDQSMEKMKEHLAELMDQILSTLMPEV